MLQTKLRAQHRRTKDGRRCGLKGPQRILVSQFRYLRFARKNGGKETNCCDNGTIIRSVERSTLQLAAACMSMQLRVREIRTTGDRYGAKFKTVCGKLNEPRYCKNKNIKKVFFFFLGMNDLINELKTLRSQVDGGSSEAEKDSLAYKKFESLG